jgi:dienelactone hydrolase
MPSGTTSSKTVIAAALLAFGALSTLVVTTPRTVVDRHIGAAEEPHGVYNQQLWWVPVHSPAGDSPDTLLETMVYRPSGAGPFPLVVINHGKPGWDVGAAMRRFVGQAFAIAGRDAGAAGPGFELAARWFVDQGFAVAVPMRQGYGRSQGVANDMVGTCNTMNYYATAELSAHDPEGVIAFMQQQGFVDPRRIIVVSHSHGGLAALGLAADGPTGVTGIINFAGGSGAWKRGKICNGRNNLIAAMNKLGLENQLPQVWLYALDDELFDPTLAREMWEAYTSSSRPKVDFVTLPATMGNGHMLFPNGNASLWGPAVREFLAQFTARADSLTPAGSRSNALSQNTDAGAIAPGAVRTGSR